MIQTLVLSNSVHRPHSQISRRILSLSLFSKFIEIRTCNLQRTPDVVFLLKLASVPGFKNSYIVEKQLHNCMYLKNKQELLLPADQCRSSPALGLPQNACRGPTNDDL